MMGIKLVVGGKAYEGWQEVIINQSLDHLVGQFNLVISEKFPGHSEPRSFKLGNSCDVGIDDKKIITGYIEKMDISYDRTEHQIQISGRDKLCDLVDCSYIGQNQLIKLKIKEIITTLIKNEYENNSFDISLDVDSSVSSIMSSEETNFIVNAGDTVFDSINKLCKSRAILPVSYGLSNKLTLTRAGTNVKCVDSLVLGKNILSGVLMESNTERFSLYKMRGHGTNSTSEKLSFLYSECESEDKYGTDLNIPRYRPYVKIIDKETNIEQCNLFAGWERNIRAGQSRSYRYTVQGWKQSNGNPWTINSKIQVVDPFFEVDQILLISEVEYKYSESGGTTTTLTITPVEKFELIENPLTKITTVDDLKLHATPEIGKLFNK